MNIFSSAVPIWVSVLFLMVIPIPIVMIANLFKKGAIIANFSEPLIRRLFLSILVFFGVFFIYTSYMSFTGIFMENTLPPKVFIYTAIPFLIVSGLLLITLKALREPLSSVPLETLVGVHLFRFIGIFFFIVEAYGALPTRFAYIGGIGDVATAVLSIIVVKALRENKSYTRSLTLAWNVFGLCDIISVLITAIITTQQSISMGTQPVTAIGAFPFSIIPAFAPATIIILHIVVFIRLWSDRKLMR